MIKTAALLLLAFASESFAESIVEGRPFLDAASEAWISGELGDCILNGSHKYDDAALGVSYSFDRQDGSGSATLYIYDQGLEEIPQESAAERCKAVIEDAYGSIEGVVKKGIYEDALFTPVEVIYREYPEDVSIHRGSGTMTYTLVRRGEEGTKERVRSLVAVTVFNNQIFKLRYTESAGLRAPEDRNVEETDEDTRAERVLKAFDYIFRDNLMLPGVKKDAKKFIGAPASGDGTEAAGALYAFAENSWLPTVSIDKDLLKRLGILPESDDDEVQRTSKILLNAYVAGNVSEQVMKAKWVDSPEAGILKAKEVYKELREKDSSIEERLGLE